MYMYANEHKCVDKSNFSQLPAQQHGSSSATGLLIVHEQRMSEWLSTTGEPTGGLNPQRWRHGCPKGLPTREPAGGSSTRGPHRQGNPPEGNTNGRIEHTECENNHSQREAGIWLHVEETVVTPNKHHHRRIPTSSSPQRSFHEGEVCCRWRTPEMITRFDGYADCCFNVGLTDQTNMTGCASNQDKEKKQISATWIY